MNSTACNHVSQCEIVAEGHDINRSRAIPIEDIEKLYKFENIQLNFSFFCSILLKLNSPINVFFKMLVNKFCVNTQPCPLLLFRYHFWHWLQNQIQTNKLKPIDLYGLSIDPALSITWLTGGSWGDHTY